jgi:WD40 repeat protein
MTGHELSEVNHIRFSPDGSKLVSVSLTGSLVSERRYEEHLDIRVWDTETGSPLASKFLGDMDGSVKWVTFLDDDEIVVQGGGSKLEKLKLCAVSTSSPTIDPSEEMEGTPTSFDLVLLTDELIIEPPSHSYRLFGEHSDWWDDQWIMDSQRRRVCHWTDAYTSACHMRKLAVGTSTGRVSILDFSNVTH